MWFSNLTFEKFIKTASLIASLWVVILSIVISAKKSIYLAQININSAIVANATVQLNSEVLGPLTQIRFGIWSTCIQYLGPQDYHSTKCLNTAFPYHRISITTENTMNPAVITSSWTGGLIVHPIPAVLAIVLLLEVVVGEILVTSLQGKKWYDHSVVGLFSLMGLFPVAAFSIDLALVIHVYVEMARLGRGVSFHVGSLGVVLSSIYFLAGIVIIASIPYVV